MIDAVTNTLAASTSASTTSSTDSASEIANTFYKLLTTQIQYQDPLNPMDNTEFTSQLAQLSSVEQLQGVNKNLTYLQLYMASINNSQALSFIGKEVNASGDTITYDGTNKTDAKYILDSDAASVVVNVYDANGTLIRTIQAGEQDQGSNTVAWDGRNSSGKQVAAGDYTFKVLATDVNGDTVSSTTLTTGTVDGITFEDGVTYLTVNGQKIAIGDILTIKEPEETTAAASQQSTSENALGKIAGTVGKLGRAAALAAIF